MTCNSCGGLNVRRADFCLHCGNALKKSAQREKTQRYYDRKPDEEFSHIEVRSEEEAPRSEDRGGCGILVASFLFPLLGIVLTILWAKEKPRSSRAALIGTVLAIIIIAFLILLSPFAFYLISR